MIYHTDYGRIIAQQGIITLKGVEIGEYKRIDNNNVNMTINGKHIRTDRLGAGIQELIKQGVLK